MNLPALDSVFTFTWRASLQACVLIVAVLLVQALAGKRLPARFRYALSLLVLLRLIVPVTPASGLSIFNLTRHVRPAPAAAPVFPSAASSALAVAPLSKQSPVALSRQPHVSWRRLDGVLWLYGGVGFLLAVFWRHRKFARWVAQLPTPADPRLIALVEQCQAEAGVQRAVRMAVVPRGNSAAVFGFYRPCLLLPEHMLDLLEHREARLVLLHELLHIRRRDVLVNWISVLALALHWFNPLAWVAMRRLRADQELACDAAVLGLIEQAERGAYGRTLLKLLHDFPAARMAAGLVPLITSRHNIKIRIIMITEFKRSGGLARACFAFLFVALGALTFTRAADDPKTTAANPGPPPAAPELTRFRDTSAATPTPKAGLDYGAEYVKESTLLEQLKAMEGGDHPRFIQALSATASDPILNSLLEQELAQETKLASLKISSASDQQMREKEAAVLNDLKQKIDRRADGIITGMSLQTAALKAAANDGLRRVPASDDFLSKRLEAWDHQRVLAEADYLEYSNILFNLNTLPTNQLASALTTAYARQLDPELAQLAERLQTAKERMVEAEQSYGEEMPVYKTAKKQLEQCQMAYQNKIEGVMAGINTRVKEAKGLMEIIQREEEKITKSKDMEARKDQY